MGIVPGEANGNPDFDKHNAPAQVATLQDGEWDWPHGKRARGTGCFPIQRAQSFDTPRSLFPDQLEAGSLKEGKKDSSNHRPTFNYCFITQTLISGFTSA
jgi:hypothetical protein